MKSPTSSVGFIEPDGILKGSIQKERIRNTTTITGKNARAMSTTTGSGSPAVRRRRSTFASKSHARPVITAAIRSTAAKSVNFSSRPITAMKSTGHATSRMPLRVSVRAEPRRVAMTSHTMIATLAAAATIAIISQSRPPWPIYRILLFFHLQDGEERLLRDFDVAHLLHAFLAGLLLLQQLPLAADVA